MALPGSATGGAGVILRKLKDIKDEVKKLPMSSEAHLYSAVVYFLDVQRDRMTYKSCLADDCRQRLDEGDSESLTCRSCGPVEDFRYKFMVPVKICDETDALKAALFDDVAMDIFDQSASELMALKDENEESFNSVIESVCVGKWEVAFRYKLKIVGDKRCGFATLVKAKKTFRECSTNRVAIKKQIDYLRSLIGEK